MFGRTGRRWLPVCLAAVGLLLATAGVATAQVLVWANYYDPGVNGNDAALAVTCDANNSVIVTGASQEGLV